jgi:hypothetical protein
MIRAAAVFSSALLAAALGAAQTSSASGAASSQSNNSPSSTSIRGCLSSSSLGDNHFTLTQNQTGTVFTLSGQADQLQSQVGHEVEIAGTDVSNSSSENLATNNDGNGSAAQNNGSTSIPNNTGRHALEVTGVRMLTDHCTASSVGPSGGPDIPQTPPTNTPHISHRGSGLRSNQKADSKEFRDTPTSLSSVDAIPNANLPGNTRVLPLLGVVGLCSLLAGFVVRR